MKTDQETDAMASFPPDMPPFPPEPPTRTRALRKIQDEAQARAEAILQLIREGARPPTPSHQ